MIMKLFRNLKRSKVIDYLIELLIVLIGVYLGMFLSDLSQEAQIEKDRKEALRGIKTELEMNMEEVRKHHESRRPFLKSYDSIKANFNEAILSEKLFDKALGKRLPNWRGIGNFNPRHSMYDAAKSSKIFIGMDLGLHSQISQVYNFQTDLYAVRNLYLEKFLNFDSQTEYKEAIILIDQIKQDLWGSQFMLIAKYEKVIGYIDEYLQ